MTHKAYAYSIKTKMVREPDYPYHGQQIQCTKDLVAFAKDLQDSDIEKNLTLYMNAQNHVICIQVNGGTTNQTIIYPREIIKHALLSGASAIIMIHNHPSGCLRPSDADIRITRTIAEIAKNLDILVHDHIIIGGDKWFSFREEGMMPVL